MVTLVPEVKEVLFVLQLLMALVAVVVVALVVGWSVVVAAGAAVWVCSVRAPTERHRVVDAPEAAAGEALESMALTTLGLMGVAAAVMVAAGVVVVRIAGLVRTVVLAQSALSGPEILVHSHRLVQVTHNEPLY